LPRRSWGKTEIGKGPSNFKVGKKKGWGEGGEENVGGRSQLGSKAKTEGKRDGLRGGGMAQTGKCWRARGSSVEGVAEWGNENEGENRKLPKIGGVCNIEGD